LIEKLMQDVMEPARKMKAAQLALQMAFDTALQSHLDEVRLRQALVELNRNRLSRFNSSRLQDFARHIRQPQGVAIVSMRKVLSGSARTFFETLETDYERDLTRWIATSDDGKSRTISLRRLREYPIILAETGRMNFVRLGRTRITYVASKVTFNQAASINGSGVRVSLTFVSDEDTEHNMMWTLTPTGLLGDQAARYTVELATLFDGGSFSLVGEPILNIDPETHSMVTGNLAGRIAQEFSDSSLAKAWFARYLTSFKFKTLGINNYNVRSFFHADCYRLQILEYAETPVLLATPL